MKDLNQIFTGFLLALITAQIAHLIGKYSIPHTTVSKTLLDIPEVVQQDAAQEKPLSPITPLLAKANIQEGEAVFKKCTQCHTIDQGGAPKIGPNLFGIIGRAIASVSNFIYSQAMKEQKGVWDPERLNQLIHNPRKFAPGTKMSFAGLESEKDRANLIAYIMSKK